MYKFTDEILTAIKEKGVTIEEVITAYENTMEETGEVEVLNINGIYVDTKIDEDVEVVFY